MGEIQNIDKKFKLFLIYLIGACTISLSIIGMISGNNDFILYSWITLMYNLYVSYIVK